MAQFIDGKLISTQIKDELKAEVATLKEKGIVPCLAVIQVGNDPASSVYVNNKKKACEFCGMKSSKLYIDVLFFLFLFYGETMLRPLNFRNTI